MNFKLLLHTLVHLKPIQIVYQVKNRIWKAQLCHSVCNLEELKAEWKVPPIPKPKCTEGDKFIFINIESEFTDWNDASRGMLWAYNQNYFDFINQTDSIKEYGEYWIDKFLKELSENKVGLDPYPIALRGINWIKFFGRYPEAMTKDRIDSLYSQYKLLQKKLEYHLLGNHILEDYYSLFIMSLFFDDKNYHKKVTDRLVGELDEQILNDGGHYEQSVMYHCIMLDRLLDCISFAEEKDNLNTITILKSYAARMLGWLKNICWNDGSYPLFNDAAYGIAPKPVEIYDYAERLDIEPYMQPLADSGYRRYANDILDAIVDVGNITATYQPGHTHADAFNYELRIDDKPFVVDTGISTYNKTERRQYERSTVAHNTVTISGHDSSEIWGGFRVGRRAKVIGNVCKTYNGGAHKREFLLYEFGFRVSDEVSAPAVSRIHLAPEVKIHEVTPGNTIITDLGTISIEGASRVEIVDCKVSREYNKFIETKCIEISFEQKLSYIIQ